MNIESLAKNCCGCAACANICPQNAIVMQEDKEGFLYPHIDSNKCTNCGLCAKICPVLNVTYNNISKPESYAVMASDEIRRNSSSGGVFPVFAYHFLENNGYVAGAVWDKGGIVKHIISNQKEDIEKMRRSKYLQSEIGNCYNEVKKILNDDKKVLFTGTPCQIAGLKSFLKKEYENLFTLEIICHATPSPKVFRKYLDENLDGEEFVSTDFRDKINGWGRVLTVTTATTTNIYSCLAKDDNFMQAFLKNLCLRPSCETCLFNKKPRQADITTGDFWGSFHYKNNLDDKKGLSIIFINNDKGQKLFNLLKKDFKKIKPIPYKKAIKGNPNLVKSTKINKHRNNFMNLVENHSLKDSLDYCLTNKSDFMILNYWYAINYGAALTCYGIQCLLEKLGFQSKVINYMPERFKEKYKDSFSQKFADKYLYLTSPVENYEDFIALNTNCSTFITGSDQVWCPKIIKTHCSNATESIYLLDFVKSDKKILSYSASFGVSEFEGDYEQEILFKHYLKQFDNISVREDDGIDILKNLGINDSTQLIDGAFLIPKEKLEEMTKDFEKKEKYIACFVLPYFKKEKWYKNLLNQIENKLELPIKYFNFDNKTPVEEWLAFIKNSEFVITDSFHGFAFSIIFNRPFVQIKNAKAQSRFESMFRLLNIEDNSIGKDDDLNVDNVLIKRDWEKINQKINEERLKAETWLMNAINNPTVDKSEFEVQNYLLTESQLRNKEVKYHLSLVNNKNKIFIKYRFYKILRIFSNRKKR